MTIATVIGARPQFIKAAVVSRHLRCQHDCHEILIHTGQHYDPSMSSIFFDELDLPQPDYYLGIGSGSHGQQTGRMLEALESVLLEICPDWVLLYGDTNSTLAGALAASKLHFPIAHVEAGLRSFNRRMPEEINRIVTDTLSDLLFAPTTTAVHNLLREGIPESKIHLVGDVMYDAALYYAQKAEDTSKILEQLSLSPKQYLLATIHRAENTDNPQRLSNIFHALAKIASEWIVVVPLHPRTRKHLADMKLNCLSSTSQLLLIEPVGYLDMVQLERNAALILTDSGGVQKEAFFYQVPCVTLREETEWVETVELGWNQIVPPYSAESIVQAAKSAIQTRGRMSAVFGTGDASKRIAKHLLRFRCEDRL